MESESGGHQIVARQPDLGVSFLHPADCRGRLQCHEQMVNGGGKLESVTEIEIETAHAGIGRWTWPLRDCPQWVHCWSLEFMPAKRRDKRGRSHQEILAWP